MIVLGFRSVFLEPPTRCARSIFALSTPIFLKIFLTFASVSFHFSLSLSFTPSILKLFLLDRSPLLSISVLCLLFLLLWYYLVYVVFSRFLLFFPRRCLGRLQDSTSSHHTLLATYCIYLPIHLLSR